MWGGGRGRAGAGGGSTGASIVVVIFFGSTTARGMMMGFLLLPGVLEAIAGAAPATFLFSADDDEMIDRRDSSYYHSRTTTTGMMPMWPPIPAWHSSWRYRYDEGNTRRLAVVARAVWGLFCAPRCRRALCHCFFSGTPKSANSIPIALHCSALLCSGASINRHDETRRFIDALMRV
jgi:hypothetical protein